MRRPLTRAVRLLATASPSPVPATLISRPPTKPLSISAGKFKLVPPGLSENTASDINDAGTVVGTTDYPPFKEPGTYQGYSYAGGVVTLLPQVVGPGVIDSPFLEGFAYGVNNSGQVVGTAELGTSGQTIATVFNNAIPTSLGSLISDPANASSMALGINDAGWIVGNSSSTGPNDLAFLYVNGQMISLTDTLAPSSQWSLTNATAINNTNMIVGQGINPQNQTHAFLLKPNYSTITGSLFNDLNGDGKKGSLEAGQANWQVYADVKGTGTYVVGDPTTMADSAGQYSLGGLNAGGYVIRVVAKTGYRQTTPTTFSETLVAAGASSVGPTFGEVKTGPYSGTPAPFTTIQAENYDLGGQGSGYNNPGNLNRGGTVYRAAEGVGVGAIPPANGGGYFVGWTLPTESLNFTVSVAATGTYTLNFRVAAAQTGGKFHLNVDGANVTGSLSIPNTADWNNYQLVSKTGVSLSAGTHVLTLVFDVAGPNGACGNFDWIQAVKT